MLKSTRKLLCKNIAAILAGTGVFLTPAAVQAATNTFNFSTTTLSASVGPSNPSSGAASFNGTNLNAGDVIVFDGVVIDTAPSDSGDWGAVNFNGAGTGGLTSATLGVLMRDGTHVAANYLCSVWTSGSSVNVGYNPTPATNRCRVEITCTQTGSTTNMSYVVLIDQGLTGTFNITNSGIGVTFPNNVVPLSFGSRNEPQTFIQVTPVIALAALSPATNTAVIGQPATFTATVTKGYPLNNLAAQWFSNGVPVLGATNLTYVTPPLTASYSGSQYSVIVTNLTAGGNVVTSTVSVLNVRTTPGFVPFNFPNTTVADGGYYGPITDPGVAISGSSLMVGDTVVFDAIITPNGSQASDAWTSIDIDGGGYANLTGAQLGVLCRQGAGVSQIYLNGNGSTSSSNPTSGGAATNRVRIELYPSATGSTTNMGWLVEIDQNLSGTFQPAVTGTNLTFPNNTLPLTFGSSASSTFVYQNPESPVSFFTQPAASQVVATGAPISVGVTVKGWYPTFQWRKNGVAISNATNQTYTVTATLADNGDQFTVVVSNRLNSANVITSTVANVSVLIPNNLSWYPEVDFTTWDTATANWTTNGGVNQLAFATGNNVTFDTLGYNIGGGTVTVTNTVSPNAVTVNPTSSETYQFSGTATIGGQSLHVTSSDSSGTLGLQAPVSFAAVTVDSGAALDVGYGGVNEPSFIASTITNNGTIDFQNTSGTLTIAAAITGSGSIIQDGAGTTVLSATNSAYTIGAINNGSLSIASTPNPGTILNNAELQPNSSASVLYIPNSITGSGHYFFSGFEPVVLTGQSSHTGQNVIYYSDVIVDNPQALGDAYSGYTISYSGDRTGGLYLSNSITWTQPFELDSRYSNGLAGTAPHLANFSGTNIVTAPLTFVSAYAAAVACTELNVEATRGELVIDASSSLANNSQNFALNLNLQGVGTGIWNAALTDGSTALNLLMRGTGTWTLGGVNTYSGTTTVASGTLLVTNQISGGGSVLVQSGAKLGGNGGVIAGPLTVASGGTLSPGLPGGNATGLLTINNSLTLSNGSYTRIRINKTAGTNDQIAGVTALTYGGTLVVTNLSGILTTNDAFQLFSAASYAGTFSSISPATPGTGLGWNTNTLAVDGTLRITVGSLATNPTNITATVVGGNSLQLSWPADHLGWTLEAQTNSLGKGLGTNWVRVASSTATNKVFVPIVTTNGSVFYRLINQ